MNVVSKPTDDLHVSINKELLVSKFEQLGIKSKFDKLMSSSTIKDYIKHNLYEKIEELEADLRFLQNKVKFRQITQTSLVDYSLQRSVYSSLMNKAIFFWSKAKTSISFEKVLVTLLNEILIMNVVDALAEGYEQIEQNYKSEETRKITSLSD